MALTLRNVTDEEVEQFASLTGEKTASKAILQAARMGVQNTARLQAANQRLAELEQALARLVGPCQAILELAEKESLALKD